MFDHDLFVAQADSTAVRIILGTAIIAVLVVVLIYVIKKFRGMAFGREDTSILAHLDDFQQMRDSGQIDDADYRKLKSQLSQQALEETMGYGDKTTPGEASDSSSGSQRPGKSDSP